MFHLAPSLSVISFWPLSGGERFARHGQPDDAVAKLAVFRDQALIDQGFEFFLMPRHLTDPDQFPADFYQTLARGAYRSVHIGDSEPDFLFTAPELPRQLAVLAEVLGRLDCRTIVIHAHHFMADPARAGRILTDALPGVEILVENNGFDSRWGADPASLRNIFAACPELKMCLDVAHVGDFQDIHLDDFIADPSLADRIGEIHFSYSTRLDQTDRYAQAGYPDYGPYHGLWSIIGARPSGRTLEFIRRHPVVLEGVVPVEDKTLTTLRREMDIVRGTA